MAEYTRKVARQNTRRRLETIKKSLLVCIRHWEDQDQHIVNLIEDMLNDINELGEEMDASVEEAEELEKEELW